MLKILVNYGRTKHIKIKYFVCDVVRENEVNLIYYSIEDQLVDLMTKAFPRPRFKVLRALLGVSSRIIKEENIKVLML